MEQEHSVPPASQEGTGSYGRTRGTQWPGGCLVQPGNVFLRYVTDSMDSQWGQNSWLPRLPLWDSPSRKRSWDETEQHPKKAIIYTGNCHIKPDQIRMSFESLPTMVPLSHPRSQPWGARDVPEWHQASTLMLSPRPLLEERARIETQSTFEISLKWDWTSNNQKWLEVIKSVQDVIEDQRGLDTAQLERMGKYEMFSYLYNYQESFANSRTTYGHTWAEQLSASGNERAWTGSPSAGAVLVGTRAALPNPFGWSSLHRNPHNPSRVKNLHSGGWGLRSD